EHVLAAVIADDEAKALLRVEEFDDAFAFADDLRGHSAAAAAAAAAEPAAAEAIAAAAPITAAAAAITEAAAVAKAAALLESTAAEIPRETLFAETVA